MVEIKMHLPDELAQRVRLMITWVPIVIEMGLVGFRTSAVQTASEIISFLATGPSFTEVMAYHVSDRAQARLRRLLALQQAGQLSQDESAELDELERIEHIMIMLKGRIHAGLTRADAR